VSESSVTETSCETETNCDFALHGLSRSPFSGL